tara:strand:+ start:339 stop:506 length:168 start_codon:yes stop_codon:yes gene_type:complete
MPERPRNMHDAIALYSNILPSDLLTLREGMISENAKVTGNVLENSLSAMGLSYKI